MLKLRFIFLCIFFSGFARAFIFTPLYAVSNGMDWITVDLNSTDKAKLGGDEIYLVIGSQAGEKCVINLKGTNRYDCKVTPNAFWGQQKVSITNRVKEVASTDAEKSYLTDGVSVDSDQDQLLTIIPDGSYELSIDYSRPLSALQPAVSQITGVLPSNSKTTIPISLQNLIPKTVKLPKNEYEDFRNLVNRQIGLSKLITPEGRMVLTNQQEMELRGKINQKFPDLADAAFKSPLPLPLDSVLSSSSFPDLSLRYSGKITNGTVISQTIIESITSSLSSSSSKDIEKLLKKYNNSSRSAIIYPISPFTILGEKVDNRNFSTKPDVCKYYLKSQPSTTGRVVQPGINPTALVWVGAEKTPILNLGKNSIKSIEKRKQNLNGINYKFIKLVGEEPLVFIIDTANSKTNVIIDKYKQNDSSGHGIIIGGTVKFLASLSDNSMVYVDACSEEGICDIAKVIHGLCDAGDQAHFGKRKVIVNLSLGTSIDNSFFKAALQYTLDEGVIVVTSNGNKDQYYRCGPENRRILAGDRCHQYPADWANGKINNSKGWLYSVGGMIYDSQYSSWVPSSDNRRLVFNGPLSIVSVYAPYEYLDSSTGDIRPGTSFSASFLTGTLAAWLRQHSAAKEFVPTCLGVVDPQHLQSVRIDYQKVVLFNCK